MGATLPSPGAAVSSPRPSLVGEGCPVRRFPLSGGPGLEKELSPCRLSPRALRPGEAAVPQRKIFL